MELKQAKQKLTEKYKDIQQEVFKINSDLLLIFDEFKDVLNKFEKQNNCKVILEKCPLFNSSQIDIQDWQNVIDDLLDSPSFDNYMDFADKIDTYLDFMIGDVKLTASCMSQKLSQDVLEYQFNDLTTFIKKNKIVLDKIDKLIENIQLIK